MWEIQRILAGMKHISGLKVIRADVPVLRLKKAKRVRKYSAEGRRKIRAARKGKPSNYRGKRQSDLAKFTLSEAKKGEKNPRMKLTEEQVLEIKEALAKGAKIYALALRYKVYESTISMIKNGKRWRHISLEDYEDDSIS